MRLCRWIGELPFERVACGVAVVVKEVWKAYTKTIERYLYDEKRWVSQIPRNWEEIGNKSML